MIADLPKVQAPALLVFQTDDADVSVEEGRFMAERIPDARLVEIARLGVEHVEAFEQRLVERIDAGLAV